MGKRTITGDEQLEDVLLARRRQRDNDARTGRWSWFHLEVAVIGSIMAAGLIQSLYSGDRWIISNLGW